MHRTAGKVHAGQHGFGDVLTFQRQIFACNIGHFVHRAGKFQHSSVYGALQPMAGFQHHDPTGHLHGDFSNRELIQKPLQNAVQRFGSHCYAVDGHDRPLVGILQLGGQLVGGITVRVSTVQQNDVGLTDGLQFGDDAALGLAVVFPRQVGHAAVGGDNDAHGCMLTDNAPCAGLGRQVKGHLVVKPGAFHQAGGVLFLMAEGTVHHVAHAVDKPCPEAAAAGKLDIDCLLRDELRLGGHDGAACGALGQFIVGAGTLGFVLDMRQQKQLGEALDKGAFACAHRPHHANINIAAGPARDILVDLFLRHGVSSFTKRRESAGRCSRWSGPGVRYRRSPSGWRRPSLWRGRGSAWQYQRCAPLPAHSTGTAPGHLCHR